LRVQEIFPGLSRLVEKASVALDKVDVFLATMWWDAFWRGFVSCAVAAFLLYLWKGKK
jgi:hypothetical protein